MGVAMLRLKVAKAAASLEMCIFEDSKVVVVCVALR